MTVIDFVATGTSRRLKRIRVWARRTTTGIVCQTYFVVVWNHESLLFSGKAFQIRYGAMSSIDGGESIRGATITRSRERFRSSIQFHLPGPTTGIFRFTANFGFRRIVLFLDGHDKLRAPAAE